MEYEDIIQQIIEFLGTFAFAISGIRHAAAKHFDWFGGYVCGRDAGGNSILDDQSVLYDLYGVGADICYHFC